MVEIVANGPDSSIGVSLNFDSIRLTEEQFYQLCRDNPEARLELTADGELIAMPPTGARTSARNMRLSHRLQSWSEKDGRGIAFDSSGGFALPNGARRSPDAAWLSIERWDALSEEGQEGFAPLCPDFVVELRSPTDPLRTLKAKMAEYIENGAKLGWLIDPTERCVYVYTSRHTEARLDDPVEISGEPLLPGFALRLKDIW